MLNLGRSLDKELTPVEMYTFDIGSQAWSAVPTKTKFKIEDKEFAEGGFLLAFNATSSCKGFTGKWVMKKYKEETLTEIERLNQDVEQQARKCIQMNSLAKYLAELFKKQVDGGHLLIHGTMAPRHHGTTALRHHSTEYFNHFIEFR